MNRGLPFQLSSVSCSRAYWRRFAASGQLGMDLDQIGMEATQPLASAGSPAERGSL
jgi:hypothetical protein